jgi:hypothetical protein
MLLVGLKVKRGNRLIGLVLAGQDEPGREPHGAAGIAKPQT